MREDNLKPNPLRALISGAAGFVGNHLVNELSRQGWDLVGFDMRPPENSPIPFILGDLSDSQSLARCIQEVRPDVVFHLAGLLKTDHAEGMYKAHVLGTIALLDAILQAGIQPQVLIAGSSAVYGLGAGDKPITEKYRPNPVTHYGISKLTQELVALRYYESNRLPVKIARTFNLLGPGLSPDMACSAFARQIALAEVRGDKTIQTGDLSAYRDFVDVRDAARAYGLIVEKGKPGEIYNVCSGQVVTIKQCLNQLLKLSTVPLKAATEQARVQKNDVPVQVGSSRKLNQSAGWRPQISLKQSLSDLLNDWRQRVKLELE